MCTHRLNGKTLLDVCECCFLICLHHFTFSLKQHRLIVKEPLKVIMESVQKREFKIMLWCSHDGFCLKEVKTDL